MPPAEARVNAAAAEVYLEAGTKRTFASPVELPGWSRSGRDAPAALGALAEYWPRYRSVLESAGLPDETRVDPEALVVVETLPGDAGTDFGVPARIPAADGRPLDEASLDRLETILRACRDEFARVVSSASGVELRKGPRGGGRDLDTIVDHVLGAETAYLSRLGAPVTVDGLGRADAAELVRATAHEALARAAAAGGVLAPGPHGGARWPARYYVRRAAWHLLDHAWEIEDRRVDR